MTLAVKNYALMALLTVATVLAPAKSALIAVMALPAADLVLALAVAIRTQKPGNLLALLRVVRSGGLKRTIAKVLMYEVATTLAFVTQSFLTGDAVPCLQVVTALIGMTELKSCLEHLDSLSDGAVFKKILDKLSPAALKDGKS